MLICCTFIFSSPCCNAYSNLCKDPVANQTLHSYESWLSSIIFCVDENVFNSYFGTFIRFSRIPILCTVGLEKKETMCEVSFVLPSDILSYILGQDDIVAKNCLFEDGPDAIGDYWGKEMPSHKARLGLSDEELATCVPLWFHEDGVPHWHSDSQPCCVMCHFHNCEFSGLRCRTWNLTVTFKLCL